MGREGPCEEAKCSCDSKNLKKQCCGRSEERVFGTGGTGQNELDMTGWRNRNTSVAGALWVSDRMKEEVTEGRRDCRPPGVWILF